MEKNEAAVRATYGGSTPGKVVETIYRAFATTGVRVNMASERLHTFVKAGLVVPELFGEFVVGCGADFAGYQLEPLGDLDNLAQRLSSEAANEKRDF
jgi:hypothetical protein